MVYLFIGQDIIDQDGLSKKDELLNRIKKQHLSPRIQDFNFDILHAKELNLKSLQERLLTIPLKSKKRIVVIKDAGALKDKEDIREFILGYVRKPHPSIILVLDVIRKDPRNKDEVNFINSIARFARIYRFKEQLWPDTFILGKQIELKRTDQALRVLKQLLENSEKPERILGGLRYAWETDIGTSLEARKRLRLLLDCDRDIKTGRLKAEIALENLVIKLCCLK